MYRHRLRAIKAPESDEPFGRYEAFLRDKSDILSKNAAVFMEGVQASPAPMRVEDFCEERKLIFIRCRGYSTHINRMQGSSYEPAKLLVFEYAEKVEGNEIHLYVNMFPKWEFKLKGGKTDIEIWWDSKK